MKSATLKALLCTLCVKHGLSSLIAVDTLCQQLVKALPTREAVCCNTYIVVECEDTL